MALKLEDVAKISRAIAEEYSDQVEVTAVAANHGGTDRVELLVTILEGHRDPYVLMINLTRVDSESMERELRAHLRRAIGEHTRSA
jgi:5,10-methylenetetrahydrofolate reductase